MRASDTVPLFERVRLHSRAVSTTAPALSTNLRAFSRTGAEARPRENQACLRVQFRAKLRGDATDNKCGACGRLTVFIVGAVYNQLGASLKETFEFGWLVTPPTTKLTRCEQGAASAVGLRSIQSKLQFRKWAHRPGAYLIKTLIITLRATTPRELL